MITYLTYFSLINVRCYLNLNCGGMEIKKRTTQKIPVAGILQR